ncbi:MAG TPA: ferrous iron transporter B [Clostridia bacterium]|nr:ferrous iron transporter B [Clostridia bacterium]
MNVYLCGAPNSGKTMLFNALTGAHERVSNRAGVTVSHRTRRMRKSPILITDLPGLCALSETNSEEGVSREQLLSFRPDLLLVVLNACAMERGLSLVIDLMRLDIPMVLAINMIDEADRRGFHIDADALSAALGVPAVPVCAKTRFGLDKLRLAIERAPIGISAQPRIRTENAQERYTLAQRVAAACTKGGSAIPLGADALFSHSFACCLVALSVAALIFYLTFGPLGSYLSSGVEKLLALVSLQALEPLLPPWLYSLIRGGIWAGVSGLLGFLPQITLLYLFMALLEDSGVFARIAFAMDTPMRRLGLSGAAVIPLIMGFGCSVPAALACRTIEDKASRRRALLLLPFCPCSAKLPLMLLLARCVLPGASFFLPLGIYLFSIALGVAQVARPKRASDSSTFALELPPYRMPTLWNIAQLLSERIFSFVARAGTVIVAASVLMWLLWRVTPSFSFTDNPEASLLYRIAALIAPIFRPAGFTSPIALTALLGGLAAKEASCAALLMLTESDSLSTVFTPLSWLCFLIFQTLCPPCFAALGALSKEYGKGLFPKMMKQTAIAYIAACLVNLFGRFFV